PARITLILEWKITGVDCRASCRRRAAEVSGRAVDAARMGVGRRQQPDAALIDRSRYDMDTRATVVFHFDFSSPYGYLGSELIEALALRHRRSVIWRPMLLGVAFKATGTGPLTSVPMKGDYSRRDFARSARFYGVPFRMPSTFPIATHAAARIVLRQRDGGADVAPLVHALYRAFFNDDRDIANPETAADIAAEAGVDRSRARAAIDDPAVKDALKREVDAALAQGVFGSPFVFVDGEPFWGVDRFDQIERWLARGEF
ncbi:MAG: 2-hydroxychromene-2-carboxylate isomerase, partial [Casimicrobiaceae bacterium]